MDLGEMLAGTVNLTDEQIAALTSASQQKANAVADLQRRFRELREAGKRVSPDAVEAMLNAAHADYVAGADRSYWVKPEPAAGEMPADDRY